MNAYLKIIRWPNLLMMAFTQLVIRYAFLGLQHLPSALSDGEYALLIFATWCIAAGGYLINDIFDREADLINKPNRVTIGISISEKQAYNVYFALNVMGVGVAFYLANQINIPKYAGIFIGTSMLLYMYATTFKQIPVLGNVLIAVLSAFVVITTGIFDLYPVLTAENTPLLGLAFDILLDYAYFCFMVSLLREMVKDLEDIEGDHAEGIRTLAVVWGVQKTSKWLFALGFVPLLAVLYYTQTYFMANCLFAAAAVMVFLVVGGLLVFLVKIGSAQTKADFGFLSKVLKFVLLSGILSLLTVSLNIYWNAQG